MNLVLCNIFSSFYKYYAINYFLQNPVEKNIQLNLTNNVELDKMD